MYKTERSYLLAQLMEVENLLLVAEDFDEVRWLKRKERLLKEAIADWERDNP